MSQTPYLGSKISLISRLDIRYEGTLYTVDSNESTIALAKVRSFGTEDRPTEHPVKARDEVYEYIIFKASDIKDLVVCEGPKQPDQPDLGGLDYDPAIVSVSKPPPRPDVQPQQGPIELPTTKQSIPAAPTKQQQPNKPVHQQSSSSSDRPPPPYHKQAWRPDNNRFQQPPQQQERQGYNNANNRTFHPQQPQAGGFQQRHNNNRPFNRTNAPKEKLKFDNDYDFVTANEEFKEKLDDVTDDLAEKVAIEADNEDSDEDENEEQETPEVVCYDKKSSFFDAISCEAIEKAEGTGTRPDWRKERQVNSETFGPQAVRSQAYHYRNRGGFNPGFRGNRQGGAGYRYQPRQEGNQQQGGHFNPAGNRPPQRFNNFNNQQQQPRPHREGDDRPKRNF